MKWLDRLHDSKLRSWCVWGLSALFAFYTFLLQGAPSVMLPQLMQTYKIDVVKIGVLASSFFYTYIVMQIPAGICIDLWGPRRILKISFLFCSISVGWFAFSQTFLEGQISRMIMGLTTAPAIISAFCLASRWFKPALFTLLVALTEFAALLGGVFGEGGISYSITYIGWRQTMIILALIGLVLTFLSLFIIHDYPDHDQPVHNGKNLKTTIKEAKKNLLSILSIKQIWINGIYTSLIFSLFPVFAALWGVPYFVARYNVSIDIAAYIASMFFIGACCGTLVLGWLSIHFFRQKLIIFIGSFIPLVLMFTMLFIQDISLPMMFCLMFLMGFFCSNYALCFSLAGNYVSKEKKGIAMGFMNMLCIAFGAPVLQPLIGYLLKFHAQTTKIGLGNYSIEDYHYAFMVLLLSLILAFFIGFFIREKQPMKES